MNLQDIQALPVATSTKELLEPSAKVAQPVVLSEAEITEALLKGDNKSAQLLKCTEMPEEEAKQQMILELVALNREIELAEAKYRKAGSDESYALEARISTLQNHKTTVSTMFINNICPE